MSSVLGTKDIVILGDDDPPSPPGAVERPRLWPVRPSTPPGGDGHCLRIRCETWLGAYGSRFPSLISRRRMRPFGADSSRMSTTSSRRPRSSTAHRWPRSRRRSPILRAPHCVGLASGLDALRLALAGARHRAGRRGDRSGDDVRRDLGGRQPGGAVPVPSTSRSPTTTSIRRGRGGDRSAHGHRARPSLRPDGRHGRLARRRAHGLRRRGCRAGARRRRETDGGRAVGTRAAFSFYPGKNLGAMGDAGALVDGRSARARVRALREHGQQKSTTTTSRVDGAAGHDPGCGASGSSR